MQISAPLRAALVKRALLNFAAIIAVSAIVGVKAMEWEDRDAADKTQSERVAAARLAAGS